jgi:hypothetical protein
MLRPRMFARVGRLGKVADERPAPTLQTLHHLDHWYSSGRSIRPRQKCDTQRHAKGASLSRVRDVEREPLVGCEPLPTKGQSPEGVSPYY